MRQLLFLLAFLTSTGLSAAPFDHAHSLWESELQSHVEWINKGTSSAVDYSAWRQDQAPLNDYLAELSDVARTEFDAWNDRQQLAFLINAYNAFTVRLILDQASDLESIKDIGGLFGSPWSKRFFTLLGSERSLDELEHDMIREWFAEPRIHMAVNCASIGCPALAKHAYNAETLDTQLDEAVRRFLSDSSRNRYNSVTGTFEISSIFKWYGDDWNTESGYPHGVRGFLLKNREHLAGAGALSSRDTEKPGFEYLDYDWSLNSVENTRE
ncbi:DUF547 domain-containing protein [Marinobacter fonticola]|uniref:DUF547 domain-containing protein n=1 Tax=Marinobacter fonticola TaxID=2603215 RepID=UPI0011E62F1B|nr:DUF547 domain-containing protein [Marinobacter fonticola]